MLHISSAVAAQEEEKDFSDGRSLAGLQKKGRSWIYEKGRQGPLDGNIGLGEYEVDLLLLFQVWTMMPCC